MKWCRTCVLPDTRPGLTIGPDGICNACVGHQQKQEAIDWESRKGAWERIIAEVRDRGSGWDCVIPVSGGKDSHWQVLKCREYDLRILGVTWKSPGRNALGQKNLENLIRIGLDHMDCAVSPEVESRFMLRTLEKVGDPLVPMHMAIFALPLRIATALRIPLVVWGENPHMEYGGSEEEREIAALDHEWLNRHDILKGTTVEDWIGGDLTTKDLAPYTMPSPEEMAAAGVRSVFLGYYFPWDPQESLRTAKAHGFEARAEGPKVGYYDYADIDCDFISVHHYFKWLKFGFTRLFDNLSLEIRNGRMSREEAIRILREKGDQTPHEDIRKLCDFLKISETRFWEIAEKFRNPEVWTRRDDRWVIPDFLISDWKW